MKQHNQIQILHNKLSLVEKDISFQRVNVFHVQQINLAAHAQAELNVIYVLLDMLYIVIINVNYVIRLHHKVFLTAVLAILLITMAITFPKIQVNMLHIQELYLL